MRSKIIRHTEKNRSIGRKNTSMTASYWLYGRHSSEAALLNANRVVERLLVSANMLRHLRHEGILVNSHVSITPEVVTTRQMDRIIGNGTIQDAVHQGITLKTHPLVQPELSDLAANRLLVVLDQVMDPHNVGAIFRTAAAFSADALVSTRRHSPPESGVLAKAASGALETLPCVRVQNLAAAISRLQKDGWLCVGMREKADITFNALLSRYTAQGQAKAPKYIPPIALVLGAEGKGLRQKTALSCDCLAALPVPGSPPSLNVAGACVSALTILAVAGGAGGLTVTGGKAC